MKKLNFLAFSTFIMLNCLYADEYISESYLEEITTKLEVIDESLESLPIVKTVEEQAREQEVEKDLVIKEEYFAEVVDKNDTVEIHSYLDALTQAKNNGKIIMLAIRATDCNYCDKMDSETLSNESVKEALKKDFITIYYNQDLEALPLGLQSGMTPNFVFVNRDENIINQYPGMRTPQEFKEVLTEILKQ